MSFNVRLFDIYKWGNSDLKDSEAEFLKLFEKESVDILCIHEFAVDHRKSEHVSVAKIKKRGHFTEYVSTLKQQTEKIETGQAIFSKYPIISSGTIGINTDILTCLYADILKDGDTIRVYNTHLESIRFQQDEYSLFDRKSTSSKNIFSRVGGLFSKLKQAYPKRIKQSKLILQNTKDTDFPSIICGDFNDPPTSYVYGLFDDQLNDAFYAADIQLGRTYAGKIPAGRIDYLFYNHQLAPVSFDILQQYKLSDHYPIVSTLRIKNTVD
jgi:endonuclease/exonuclease/phosphatase family metal-dependent hydrolase